VNLSSGAYFVQILCNNYHFPDKKQVLILALQYFNQKYIDTAIVFVYLTKVLVHARLSSREHGFQAFFLRH